MEAVMLSIREVRVRFGMVEALAGVSLEVAEGEVVGLIGPNGAGKSTLLDAVSGLAPLRSGQITFRGIEITGRTQTAIARVGVARTFQSPRLFDRMTVLANVLAAQHTLPPPLRRSERIMELVERAGLAERRDALSGSLTPGERRRVELARALAREPALLLLDEPCGGMTSAESAEMAALIQWGLRGAAVVIVEHKLTVISRLCSRVVVLHLGTIIAEGTPAAIRDHPEVVEAYLGRTVFR